MFMKYFEVWMNYNTLTLNTYKVKTFIDKFYFKDTIVPRTSLSTVNIDNFVGLGGNKMVCPAVYTIISIKLSLDLFTRYIRLLYYTTKL